MKHLLTILLLSAVNIMAFDTTFSSTDTFLKRHVCNGEVNYQTASADALVDSIVREFASLSAEEFAGYTEDTRLAGLINLYNIATIKLITTHMPLKSIRDIPAAWSKNWIDFGGEKVSLDHLEHDIIRKEFDEPRIHYALVCAAKSCPALKKGAYTSENLDAELTEAARIFLTDTSKNLVEKKVLKLSAIFNWYGSDFKKKYGGYQNFVIQTLGLKGTYSVKFRTYDWQLNNVPCTE